MSDKSQVDAGASGYDRRGTACIDTKKICDSCIDKDCIEDLRVYLSGEGQRLIDQCGNVKPRCAELLYVSVDVEAM